jgi:hypothetical protein
MSENGATNRGDHSRSNHNQHDARYHLVYVFGYAALSLAVDFIFIWPESHLFALLFLAAAFSLLALYELRNFRSDWSIVVPAILFMAALTAYAIVGPVLPTETDVHGWLEPANEPFPKNSACLIDILQRELPNGMLFSLGKPGMWFQKKSGGKRPLLTVGACTLMSAEFKNNQLLFNADIYDQNRQLVARIEQNEFHLVPGMIAYPSRPDRHTLGVYSKDGNLLFSIYFRNKDAIDVSGTFICSDGLRAKVEKDGNLTLGGPKGSTTWDRTCFINSGGFVAAESGWSVGPTPVWACDPGDIRCQALGRARGEH